jgi:hypothetical protein
VNFEPVVPKTAFMPASLERVFVQEMSEMEQEFSVSSHGLLSGYWTSVQLDPPFLLL